MLVVRADYDVTQVFRLEELAGCMFSYPGGGGGTFTMLSTTGYLQADGIYLDIHSGVKHQ